MAHFAKLDGAGNVLEVHVVNNIELLDSGGVEQEMLGVQFLINWSGGHPFWKQTSYNGKFRKHFASAGFTYDAQRDAFIPPKPFASWVLNEDTCLWEPPVAMPTEGGPYVWDETAGAWVAI